MKSIANACSPVQPVELLILQPTPFCNLNCDYCYLPGRNSTAVMPPDLLMLACERLRDSPFLGDTLSVIWHAGEPLVLAPDYYEAAASTIGSILGSKVAVKYCFQTNATLINDPWIDYIKRRKVSIGVSLDGPKFLNDAQRKNRAGHGSFDKALRGIQKLQQAQIPFHVICVLTKDALSHAAEIFNFFIEHKLYEVGFNIEEIESDNSTSSLDRIETPTCITDFFSQMIALNATSPAKLNIRETEGMTAAILGFIADDQLPQQSTSLKILSIDVNGNMSAFSPELLGAKDPVYNNFIFGNVRTHSLEQMVASSTFIDITAKINAGIEKCKSECDYFGLCGGGAPGNKYFEHNRFDATETLYCQHSVKALADAVLTCLEHDLAQTG